LSVYLREDAVIGQLDSWIGREFAPHRLNETIHDLAAVPLRQAATLTSEDEETARKIAECDRKLAGYRATLDAGTDPKIVAAWITETEAEKARYQLTALPVATARRMSEAEIKSIVDKLADIARVLIDADPEDKAEVFRQLGLKLTYHPGRMLVEAEVRPTQFGFFDGVRGGLATYVHRPGRPDHGVYARRRWRAMSADSPWARTRS
jgi:site-specific DNA recombinase